MNGNKDKSDTEQDTNTGIWVIRVLLNKKNKIGVAYSAYGGGERRVQGFGEKP
jgi:hypothetical protein